MNKIALFLLSTTFLFTNSISYQYKKELKELKITENIEENIYKINSLSPEKYNINILIKFNYNNFDKSSQLINRDLTYEEKIDYISDYYSTKNKYFVNKYKLNSYNTIISSFSPYIEIVFDSIKEYNKSKNNIIKRISNANVSSVSVNYLEHSESSVNDGGSSYDYNFNDILNDIGINNPQFSGDGIKIGIIEPNIPSHTYNLKSNLYTCLTPTENPSEHTTLVTSIVGGYSGIAQDAHIFCAATNGEDNSLLSRVNYLLQNHVNIINISAYYSTSYGIYNCYCGYIDHIIEETGCTFVKSAGNKGLDEHPLISTPGCAMKAITVGSICYEKKVSDFSSWYTNESFLLKPDIVAPGENICGIPNISNYYSGTSFAAPTVTGIIALLMEEFPILKTNPSLVKAALHNGCTKLPSQSTFFDEQCGFGLVNYENARNYLSTNKYNLFMISQNAHQDSLIVSCDVTVPAYSTINIVADWTIHSNTQSFDQLTCRPQFSTCTLKLLDIQSNTFVSTSELNSNVIFIEYLNAHEYDKQYKIYIFLNEHNDTCDIYGALCCNYVITHEHTYTCTYVSPTQHYAICSCGIGHLDSHVVRAGSFNNGQRFAVCMLCGGLCTVALEYHEGINPQLQRTINGSYILPNGIIVLVDEDIEDYLLGTLEFYYPNNDPTY